MLDAVWTSFHVIRQAKFDDGEASLVIRILDPRICDVHYGTLYDVEAWEVLNNKVYLVKRFDIWPLKWVSWDEIMANIK